jgi:hypothetical protein
MLDSRSCGHRAMRQLRLSRLFKMFKMFKTHLRPRLLNILNTLNNGQNPHDRPPLRLTRTNAPPFSSLTAARPANGRRPWCGSIRHGRRPTCRRSGGCNSLMNRLAIASIVWGCSFGAALVGMVLHVKLPDRHLDAESRDVVKLVMGLIATMAALVLSLLIASANTS